jgi:hypothetical protein
MLFLDHSRIAVAGGQENGEPFLWLYDVSDAEGVLKAEEHKQEVELPQTAEASRAAKAFHSLARTQANDRVADALLTAASSERVDAGLWRVAVRANTLGESLQPSAASSKHKLGRIRGIAVASEGYIVVACPERAESTKPGTLRYLSPIDGRIVLEISTRLSRIAALAYSPSGNLYAANLATADESGGVYRIDDASDRQKPACKEVKIAEAEQPTGLAFGPDGAFYVTVLGKIGGNTSNAGSLLKLTGEF